MSSTLYYTLALMVVSGDPLKDKPKDVNSKWVEEKGLYDKGKDHAKACVEKRLKECTNDSLIAIALIPDYNSNPEIIMKEKYKHLLDQIKK